MLKKFSILFLLLFVSVQTLAFQHMAEHQFEPHDHDEHTCGICLYVDQGKSSSDDVIAAVASVVFTYQDSPFYRSFIPSSLRGSTQPRAPPVIT